nr:hypothetical protein [Hyphomonas sp. Mor2]
MASSHIRPADGHIQGKWAVWFVAGFFLLMLLPRITDVLAGWIPGADDLMRLQQIRDLLDGQGWFNVDQTRMLTPEGGDMHWSRLPDLFIAAFILLTEPVLGRDLAEALAIGLWPILLLAAAFTFLTLIMRRLQINRAGQVFGLICFATSAAVYNFWPGRIDHHGLVVVLTLGGLVAVLSPGLTGRSGAILALSIASMLTIALESLPYVAGLIAIKGLFWIVRGHREGVRLATFGLALMVFATGYYLFDAPGLGAGRVACDAYGNSHWAGFMLGGGLLALLGVFGGALETWSSRLIAGAMAGAATLSVIYLVNPGCLADPYANVSDAVRVSWLSMVGEAKPLSTLWAEEPGRVVWVFGFLATASLATAGMVVSSTDAQRTARVGIALLFTLSVITTIWQIRGQSFSHVFAAIGAAWLAGALFSRWREAGGVQPLLVFVAGVLLLSPITWEQVSAQVPSRLPSSKNMACIHPDAYTDLADRAPMRLHAPIILGSSLIARTPHTVLAGPYHRNIEGIDRSNAVLIGPVDEAHARLLDMGATHLVFCKGLRETTRYGEIWPDGLAAQLNQDQLPDWLEPADTLAETDGVVRLYRVKPE